MDVSGSIPANLDAGYPCRHDKAVFSPSVGERNIREHFVMKQICENLNKR